MNSLYYGPDAQSKIAHLRSCWSDLIHVLTDFDKTLTYARVDGSDTPSIISVLYNNGYLSNEYSQAAKQLEKTYRPIEDDMSIPLETRKEQMLEWWTKHRELLIKSNLSKHHIQQVVDSNIMKLRDGCIELLQLFGHHHIPVIIMSASGLWTDTIDLYLQKYLTKFDHIHSISNGFERDDTGIAVAYKLPIITSLNKDETVISQQMFPEIYADISSRKNVILMGDQIGDLGMVAGFEHDMVLKIWFCNDPTPEKLSLFQSSFDIVILGSEWMDALNKLFIQTLWESITRSYTE